MLMTVISYAQEQPARHKNGVQLKYAPMYPTTTTTILTIDADGLIRTIDIDSVVIGGGADGNDFLTSATLNGTTLELNVQNQNQVTANLSALQDGTGTDDQIASEVPFSSYLTLTSANLQAVIEELKDEVDIIAGGGSDGNDFVTSGNLSGTDLTLTIPNQTNPVIDLSGLQDGTGTDDQTAAEVSYSNATSGLTASQVQAAIDEVEARVDANDAKVTNTDSQTLSFDGTNVSITGGNSVDVSSLSDGTGTDDQTATEVPFTPYSTIAATNVQAAIQEMLDEASGGGISSLLDDTSPQLGGDLDMNNFSISSDFILDATGTTNAAPRVFGIDGWASTEAARFTFGDVYNMIQSGNGEMMDITSYNPIRIFPARQTLDGGLPLANAGTETGTSLIIDNYVNTRIGVAIRSGTAQSADLLQFQNSSGTELSSFDNTGAFDGDVVFTPYSTISSTTVQGAIQEVLDEATSGGSTEYAGFLRPEDYGAAMDGVTDDRNALQRTIDSASSQKKPILIDGDLFFDSSGEADAIMINDNVTIIGTEGSTIKTNFDTYPAFIFPLSDSVTIKNITFLYDQNYTTVWGASDDNPTPIHDSLKTFYSTYKNLTFSSGNPRWGGPSAYRCYFYLRGASNITFEDCEFKAVGTNANTFIPHVFRMIEEYSANQTITTEADTDRTPPRNFTLKNIVFDGTIMGIQGLCRGFHIDGLTSYRYSDIQDTDGTDLGGNDGSNNYTFPPPHLMYINQSDNLTNPDSLYIKNVVDFGEYIGNSGVRPTISGYMNSLKLTDSVSNVMVDGYSSYRRDGLADFEDLTHAVLKNMYSESYNSDLFSSISTFPSVRFLGDMNDVRFENITVKDLSSDCTIYPWEEGHGNNVYMDNVHIYVKEYSGTEYGVFGIDGENNTIVNSSLNIENHSSTQTLRGVAYVSHNRGTLKNNYYDVIVNGWRDVSSDPGGYTVRMSLLTDTDNPNSNFIRVTDTSNDMVLTHEDGFSTTKWKRKEVLTLGSGSNDQFSNINIPSNYYIKKVVVLPITATAAGTITLGTSTGTSNDLMTSITNTAGQISIGYLDETNDTGSQRDVYLHTSTDFSSTGEYKVILFLERIENLNYSE